MSGMVKLVMKDMSTIDCDVDGVSVTLTPVSSRRICPVYKITDSSLRVF